VAAQGVSSAHNTQARNPYRCHGPSVATPNRSLLLLQAELKIEPGDVIATGTAAGVGASRQPFPRVC
jgi:hypothetical protein